jgi:hypothetical protein
MAVLTLEHASNTQQRQPASGWSVFWAMSAIVLHAMLQPSFTGYFWNRKTFEGSLWPHRSSPFVCLVDMVADIYTGVQVIRNQGFTNSDGDTRSGRNGAMTRLALFGLGVVPQAIKLFSIEGIPYTQATAAMYLLPSTTSVVVSLIVPSPEEELQALADLDSNDSDGWWTLGNVQRATFLFGWMPHLAGIYMIWYGVVLKIGLSAPEDFVNAAQWISTFVVLAATVYFIQQGLFILVGRKSPVSVVDVLMYFIMLSSS